MALCHSPLCPLMFVTRTKGRTVYVVVQHDCRLIFFHLWGTLGLWVVETGGDVQHMVALTDTDWVVYVHSIQHNVLACFQQKNNKKAQNVNVFGGLQ